MKEHRVKKIPVVSSDGKTLSVLNARDLLQNLWREFQQEEDLMFKYVMNVGYR